MDTTIDIDIDKALLKQIRDLSIEQGVSIDALISRMCVYALKAMTSVETAASVTQKVSMPVNKVSSVDKLKKITGIK